jgi:hypothetical protein
MADARTVPSIDSGDSVVGVELVAPMDMIGMNEDRGQNRSAACKSYKEQPA